MITFTEEISKKVTNKESLTQGERSTLIDGIFNAYLKDDDPKYDQANQEWLNSLTDELLHKKYLEYCS